MASLPKFMVLQVEGCGWVKHGDAKAVVVENGEGVFDPLSKIEVERSKSNADYVHLRFCQSNKYWARSDDGWVVANTTKPEEDASKPSCTLFWYVAEGGFRHVQSGRYVNMKDSNRMYVVADPKVDTGFAFLTILDWGTFAKLPKHVAFKGDNGKYLEAYGSDYLNFSSDDANGDTSGHQIHLLPDGRIFIESDFFDKFWRLSSDNWICGDTDDAGPGYVDTLFWPVKISGTTIALRSESNHRFCRRFEPDYLSASVPTITKEARFEVQERILSRKVYNVKYRIEDARIYGEKPFVAGTTTANNNTNKEALISFDIPYQEFSSYTFSRSVSVTGGVKFTLDVGIPFITHSWIEISPSVTTTYQWSETKKTTKSVKATGAVSLQPKSSVIVKYVGTKGTCDIPFSYTQEDQSSTDHTITTEMTDGVFTGSNSYNFSFEFEQVTRL